MPALSDIEDELEVSQFDVVDLTSGDIGVVLILAMDLFRLDSIGLSLIRGRNMSVLGETCQC